LTLKPLQDPKVMDELMRSVDVLAEDSRALQAVTLVREGGTAGDTV
jgi:hypothetical protein